MGHYLRLLFVLLTLFVSACTIPANDGKPLAQMTFDHVKPFPVYVASYKPVNLNSGVVHALPEGFVSDPSELIFDYLSSRFEASGHQGKLKIEINDVSIQHEIVDSDNGVGSLIGFGKKDHYHVKVDIDVIALGLDNFDQQKRSLVVSRNIFISEHVSLVEREKLEMQALDSMVDDLDITLRKILKEQFNVLR